MKNQYYNKIEIWKYTNNKYYDICHYFFCKTPIYLRIFFIYPQNYELSGDKIVGNVYY